MNVNVMSDQQTDLGFKHYIVFGNCAPWNATDDNVVQCLSEEDAHKLKGLIEKGVKHKANPKKKRFVPRTKDEFDGNSQSK